MRILLIASAVATAACVCTACGGGSDSPAPPKTQEAPPAAPRDAAPAVLEVPARALGQPDVAAFRWRTRAGQTAFKAARAAAAANDWASVTAACRQALAADPTHLGAAWLLALALAEQHRPAAEILEPLQAAVAGDFETWARPSLESGSLQAFLATPIGAAWKRRVADDRGHFVEALARSIIVVADGELFAYDPVAARYFRLTNSGGAVVGALAAPVGHRIAYVTREGKRGKRELAAGIVDLADARTLHAQKLGAPSAQLAYTAKGLVVGAAGSWRKIVDAALEPLPPKSQRPLGRWLEVAGKTARLHAVPVPTITADWDDQGLASAMRIGSSAKIITVPGGGLVDGNSVVWSPDHTRLAFVAQLQPDSVCTPGVARAAVYAADAATGAVSKVFVPDIAKGKIDSGVSVEWVSDRMLAVACAEGVMMVGLSGEKTPIAGAQELVTPRRRPACEAPAPDDDSDEPAE